MQLELSKTATSRQVCDCCCEENGTPLRWGSEGCDSYDEEWCRDNFYCPVTDRTVHNPDHVGSVQPDCPRLLEHLHAANPDISEVQLRLFGLEHESYRPERLKHSPEESVYLERWKKENARQAAMNRGYTLLEHILCPPEREYPGRVSQRDAYVAASVIQWLGTNCGRAFLDECAEEIPEAKKCWRVAERLMGRAW